MSARRQVGQIVARPRSIWDTRHLARDDVRVSVYSALLETRDLEAVLPEGLGGLDQRQLELECWTLGPKVAQKLFRDLVMMMG